jgi:hypothetical protein
MEWTAYQQDLWHNQSLPPLWRHVLCQIDARQGHLSQLPPAVAVGYLTLAAGDEHSPHFVVPGVGGPVVAWCDCLGDDFRSPLMGIKNWWERIKPETQNG